MGEDTKKWLQAQNWLKTAVSLWYSPFNGNFKIKSWYSRKATNRWLETTNGVGGNRTLGYIWDQIMVTILLLYSLQQVYKMSGDFKQELSEQKQRTFRYTTGFLANWRLRNEHRKRAESIVFDFRCPNCRSVFGQASCLVCARRSQLTFPFCC